MSDEAFEVTTAFLVVVQRGGDISVLSDNFPDIRVQRVATLTDVETYCSQAAREAGRLIERAMHSPPDPSSRVRKAVARRRAEG